MTMFCVKCGKEGETFKGRCMDCFLEGRELLVLPTFVDLERCTGCDEFRVEKKWRTMDPPAAAEEAALSELKAIADASIDAVGVSSERQDERNFEVKVEADLEIDEHLVNAEAGTVVRIKNTVCHRCSRQLGNYYEAILQLRGSSKEMDKDVRDEMMNRVLDKVEAAAVNNRQMFISKVQEIHGGLDFYMSSMSLSKSIARELANEFGAEVKESSTLVGKKEGEDMYRLTHLVRLPPYKLGDVVEHHGRPHQLMQINKQGGKLLALNDFRITSLRPNELHSLKVLGGEDDIREAVVVARYEGEIQVLDPSNYRTVTLRVPEMHPATETVKVFDHEGELLLVP